MLPKLSSLVTGLEVGQDSRSPSHTAVHLLGHLTDDCTARISDGRALATDSAQTWGHHIISVNYSRAADALHFLCLLYVRTSCPPPLSFTRTRTCTRGSKASAQAETLLPSGRHLQFRNQGQVHSPGSFLSGRKGREASSRPPFPPPSLQASGSFERLPSTDHSAHPSGSNQVHRLQMSLPPVTL